MCSWRPRSTGSTSELSGPSAPKVRRKQSGAFDRSRVGGMSDPRSLMQMQPESVRRYGSGEAADDEHVGNGGTRNGSATHRSPSLTLSGTRAAFSGDNPSGERNEHAVINVASANDAGTSSAPASAAARLDQHRRHPIAPGRGGNRKSHWRRTHRICFLPQPASSSIAYTTTKMEIRIAPVVSHSSTRNELNSRNPIPPPPTMPSTVDTRRLMSST